MFTFQVVMDRYLKAIYLYIVSSFDIDSSLKNTYIRVWVGYHTIIIMRQKLVCRVTVLFIANSDQVTRNSPRESGFYHQYQQITRQRERDPDFFKSIAIDIGKIHRLRECESNLLKYYDMKSLDKVKCRN